MKSANIVKFSLLMASFGILLGITMAALDNGLSNQKLGIIICLIPAVPFGFAIASLVKHIRTLDELKIKITLESAIITIFVVLTLSIVFGLLELNGFLKPIPILVFPIVLITLWGLIQLSVSKRYS